MHKPNVPLTFSLMLLAIAGCLGPAAVPTPPTIVSGLQKGDDIESWNPIHVAGPNKGTNACPICTYLARPAVVIFAAKNAQLPQLASNLQNLIDQNQTRQLKGFLIALNSTPQQLQQLAEDQHIKSIGLCYPDPATREHDLQLYKINPQAANTIMIYKDYKIADNFVDLKPEDFPQVTAAIAELK
jgi:protocatechuate 3,4-dioxygenase, beta subunit